jgi:hypothetical protein
MENLSYKRVSGILYVENNKLKSKTMNIAKIADNAYITRPVDDDIVTFVLELNGVYWVEADVTLKRAYGIIPKIPRFLEHYQNDDDFAECGPSPKAEIRRRAVHPELPPVWELEDKKANQLPDGMVRVHALRYKQDGNSLTDIPITLTKVADGVYSEPLDDYSDLYYTEINGVIFRLGAYVKCTEETKEQIISRTLGIRDEFVAAHTVDSDSDCYFNILEIEVMKRLGYDTTPLWESRRRFLEKREEDEARERAESEAKEKARKEAEEMERNKRLATSRAKIEHGEFVSTADFLELADSVGFKIHPRTRGLLLSSVIEIALGHCRYRNIPGKKKKTSDSFNGVHEAYSKLRYRITH